MSDYDLFEFRHLKFFAAIAEEGNLTAAAVRLNTCQSNLSTQIKQLEGIFDTELLERDHDGVSLTASGHVLLAGAYEALQLREDIVEMLKAIAVTSLEPVRLGFCSLVEQRLLSAVCEELRTLLPGTEVKTVCDSIDNLERCVRSGELHCALVTLPITSEEDITTLVVEKEPFAVCLRNDDPLAQHESLPAHLLSRRLAVFEYPLEQTHAHERLLEMLADIGIVPLDAHPTSNFEHVQWMVLQNECYALIRGKRNLMPGLTTRPIHGVDWTCDTAIIGPPAMQHPALALLLREKRKVIQKLRLPSRKPLRDAASKRQASSRRNRKRQSPASSMSLFKQD